MTITTTSIVLILALFVEIGLTIISLVTKSYQLKTRCAVQIVAFLLLLVACITGLVRWRLTNLPFMILLALLVFISILELIRKKKDQRVYSKSRLMKKAVFMYLFVFLALLPSLLFPEYQIIGTTGAYKVATNFDTYIDINRIETYTDTGEYRKLNVEFWYPEETNGAYPLIVFSHGGFGIKTSNESLFYELASHGYVVCSIDHTYQCLSTTDKDGNTIPMDSGYRKEVMKEDAKVDKQNSFACYQKWMNIRTGDINFVLDYIIKKTKTTTVDPLYQLIDCGKIGVMGHSLGGSAALGLGRSREDVSAVIALESPFMCDISGVQNNEFVFINEKYPKPVLNVYSDSIWSLLPERAQYAENNAMRSDDDPDTFSVYIKGAGHLTLTDLALTTPILTSFLDGNIKERNAREVLKIINDVSLEFFDCYLKGKGSFTSEGTYE